MSGILPTERIAPTKVNPSILILYGPPKIGKTSKLAELDDTLILDLEEGADFTESKRVAVYGISGPTKTKIGSDELTTSLDVVLGEIAAKGNANINAGMALTDPKVWPFRRLATDTVDALEEFCIRSATIRYKASTIGKNFDDKNEGLTVLDLPKGLGYYYLREEVKAQIRRIKSHCKELILIAHTKDKITEKDGREVTTLEVSLTGKIASIVCSMADAIGYVYREPGKGKDLMVSFESYDTAMGARFPRLAGQKMIFDWNRIYVPE